MALGRATPIDGAVSSISPSRGCSCVSIGCVACKNAVANGESCKGPWPASRSPGCCSSGWASAGGAEALRRVLWVLSTTVSSMSRRAVLVRKEDSLAVVARAWAAGVVVFLGNLCAGPGLEASPTLTPRSGCKERCIACGARRCKRM
eukprot:1264911-Amphidinium_carterae.3